MSTVLKAAIVAHLSRTKEKKESISFLLSTMRDQGFVNLGHLERFEKTVIELGFTIDYVWRADGRVVVRRNVCLGDVT